MKQRTNLIAFITALSLHLIIGGLLIMGVSFSLPKDQPKASAAVIDATIINQEMLDTLAKNADQKKKRQQQEVDNEVKEKQRQEAEEKLKAEEEEADVLAKEQAAADALVKEQAEKEKADALAKEQAEKAKADALAKEQAEKAKADALAKEQAEKAKADALAKEQAEKAKADALAKEKAEKEKAAKLAKEKAEKEKAVKLAKEKAEKAKAAKLAKEKAAKAAREKQRQAELDRQMEAEFSDDFSSARTAKQLSEIAKYEALIRSKISRYWKVDQSMSGKTCTLAIKLAADGYVISAVKSRGDSRLCASAIRATQQAKTLPIPKDASINGQFRDFDITLKPEL
ncbi:cell envelope integrity protein TolA [Psychromonas aquatilis]|uniref:Cell envelope integrity protein TolA n=1 Tax=Psychromonas aquatilis TaxID=2005072 RepID=A0ABU9GSP2_9GAMM